MLPISILPEDRHIAISLVNSARNFVVTGPPIALYGSECATSEGQGSNWLRPDQNSFHRAQSTLRQSILAHHRAVPQPLSCRGD